MSEKPEALRLADMLEKMPLGECDNQAAAELRRLHASCEDYAQHKKRQDQRILELAERVLELKAQRDALLEALKLAVRQNEHDMVMTGEECRQCRAAIAKAREA